MDENFHDIEDEVRTPAKPLRGDKFKTPVTHHDTPDCDRYSTRNTPYKRRQGERGTYKDTNDNSDEEVLSL